GSSPTEVAHPHSDPQSGSPPRGSGPDPPATLGLSGQSLGGGVADAASCTAAMPGRSRTHGLGSSGRSNGVGDGDSYGAGSSGSERPIPPGAGPDSPARSPHRSNSPGP